MKVYHNPDETGVTLSDRDKEVVRSSAEMVDSLLDLADAAGFTTDGPCEHCGEKARLRPFPAADESGEPITLDVCAECQVEIGKRQIEANRGKEPVRDDA